ncbi:hypothetical protein CDAR_15691 [Caerostris darwini]|uniref:Uncharacterized protein n=1 Tax=Caerostris darwini TaxID=1538125 RepID=A0AAV4Q758_9ARAC|nr:hypothetical protein CDAR_15691 [Caerostris darwini]
MSSISSMQLLGDRRPYWRSDIIGRSHPLCQTNAVNMWLQIVMPICKAEASERSSCKNMVSCDKALPPLKSLKLLLMKLSMAAVIRLHAVLSK